MTFIKQHEPSFVLIDPGVTIAIVTPWHSSHCCTFNMNTIKILEGAIAVSTDSNVVLT